MRVRLVVLLMAVGCGQPPGAMDGGAGGGSAGGAAGGSAGGAAGGSAGGAAGGSAGGAAGGSAGGAAGGSAGGAAGGSAGGAAGGSAGGAAGGSAGGAAGGAGGGAAGGAASGSPVWDGGACGLWYVSVADGYQASVTYVDGGLFVTAARVPAVDAGRIFVGYPVAVRQDGLNGDFLATMKIGPFTEPQSELRLIVQTDAGQIALAGISYAGPGGLNPWYGSVVNQAGGGSTGSPTQLDTLILERDGGRIHTVVPPVRNSSSSFPTAQLGLVMSFLAQVDGGLASYLVRRVDLVSDGACALGDDFTQNRLRSADGGPWP